MVIKMVNIKKRGNVYQYQFEIAPVDGKRKYINKSGFKSKREAMEAGVKAYNEYFETGHSFKPSTMSSLERLIKIQRSGRKNEINI